MGANDEKETPKWDKRILGEKFILCDRCGRPIREFEAVDQKGLMVCPDDVDVLDHEDEVG